MVESTIIQIQSETPSRRALDFFLGGVQTSINGFENLGEFKNSNLFQNPLDYSKVREAYWGNASACRKPTSIVIDRRAYEVGMITGVPVGMLVLGLRTMGEAFGKYEH